MRFLCLALTLLGYVTIARAQPELATTPGRLQMVPLPHAENRLVDEVLVLDSQTGDLWKWAQSPGIGNTPGFHGIQYLGRVTTTRSNNSRHCATIKVNARSSRSRSETEL